MRASSNMTIRATISILDSRVRGNDMEECKQRSDFLQMRCVKMSRNVVAQKVFSIAGFCQLRSEADFE